MVAERSGSFAVRALTTSVLLFALWRATLGANLSDDGYGATLALRMAKGAQPFADEMNVQVLGSIWAVPFVWLWVHLVGLTGLVLASRLFFVLLAFLVGVLAYRALRPSFGPVSAVAVIVVLLSPPYGVLAVTYNTSPHLAFVLASSAGLAAVRDGNPRWALIAGAMAVVGTVSYPSMLAGALVLLVTIALLSRSVRVTTALVVGAAAVALPIVLWLLLVITPAAISDTLSYMSALLGHSATPADRLMRAALYYQGQLALPAYWPTWALAALGCVPRLPRLRAVSISVLPVALAVPGVWQFLEADGEYGVFGVIPASFLTVGVLALLVPVCIHACHGRPDLVRLLAIGIPFAVVSVPAAAAYSSGGYFRGASFHGLAPLAVAVLVGWGLLTHAALPTVSAALRPLLVAVVASLSALTPFGEPPPWDLTTRVPTGAYAGLQTSAWGREQIAAIEAAGRAWVSPGEAVLFYRMPCGYLLVDAPSLTNIVWLTNYGAANNSTVSYLRRQRRLPAVVFVHRASIDEAGGLTKLARQDPLIRFVVDRYTVVQADAGRMVVLRVNEAPPG